MSSSWSCTGKGELALLRVVYARAMAIPDETRQAFLDRLRVLGNVSRSARDAGVNPGIVYRWRKEDEAFAEAWEEAQLEAADYLEE